MRELKFRIWNKKFNCWDTIDSISGDFNEIFKMDCFIFQQYTGLTDKNGKEIYEGDILEYKRRNMYNDDNVVYRDVVDLTPSGMAARVKRGEAGEFAPENVINPWNFFYYSFEVVGNIFENPDLIK